MKRSTQVSLVLMTAAGIGGGAYALSPDSCRQPPPSAVASAPQRPPSALASDPQPSCRSHGSSSHGSSWHFYSGSGSSSSSTSSPSTTSTSTATSRGGFGSIGRAFASFSGGS